MQVSKQVGRFHVSRVLGTGGKGVVYAARDGEHAIALKLLRDGLVANEKEKLQFFREAAAMARVAHPALVRVLEAGELPDGRPYLCMPLLDGETLAARLLRGPFELDAALVVFEKLVGATAAIHDEGLVHRDIKPENVFLTSEYDPVLLDLGLAREVGSPLTTTGVVTGTRAYMAPERFFGRAATVASDVYELALVLYLMLTGGSLPWTDDSDPQARLNPAPLEARLAPSPHASIVSGAVARALSPRPELRFASVRELLAGVLRTGEAPAAHRVTEDLPAIAEPVATESHPPASTAHPPVHAVAERAPRRRRTLFLSVATLTFVAAASLLVVRAKLASDATSERVGSPIAPAADIVNTGVSTTMASSARPETVSDRPPSEAPAPNARESPSEASSAIAPSAPARTPPHPRAKGRVHGPQPGSARPPSVPVDDRSVYEHR